MLPINLSGRRAFIAGVSDDVGFAFWIAKALAEAGAEIVVGVWPPVLNIFRNLLDRGKMDDSRKLARGGLLEFSKIYPLDAAYDTYQEVPEEVRSGKRYAGIQDFTLDGVVNAILQDFGEKPLDLVVHSIANGPEVKKPLIETSRQGYLAALNASAYSFVSMVQRFGPLMREQGAFISLTYLASTRVIPGYGGGMSSAKAALESDTRVLAFEAGRRFGVRVNCISAGPYRSRAASSAGDIDQMVEYCSQNSPLAGPTSPEDVGATAAFLASPLARGITGSVIYVDMGYHVMGMPIEQP